MELILYWVPVIVAFASYANLKSMGKDAQRLDSVSSQSLSLYVIIVCTIIIATYIGIDLAISFPQARELEELPALMWNNLHAGLIFEVLGQRSTFFEFISTMTVCVVLAYVMTNHAYYNSAGLKDEKIISSYVETAWYYEAWTERCTRIVTQKVGNTTTVRTETYYVRHSAHWDIVLGDGTELSISDQDYDNYVQKFRNETKKHLHRASQSSSGDGNAYYVTWPKTDATLVPATYVVDYFNYVTASKNTLVVSRGDEARYKNFLVEYPETIDSNFGEIDVDRVLTPGIQFDETVAQEIDDRLSKYLAKKGQEKDVNILVYLTNQPISFWDALHEQWKGAKFNDVIVVVSIDEATRRINWTKTIAWDNTALCAAIDNDMMQLSYFYSASAISDIITRNVDNLYVAPDVDKYAYLMSDVTLPWYSILLTSLGAGLVSSLLVSYFYHFGYAEVWAPFEAMLTALWEWIVSLLNK